MTGFYLRHNCHGLDAKHHYPRRSVELMRKGLTEAECDAAQTQGQCAGYFPAQGPTARSPPAGSCFSVHGHHAHAPDTRRGVLLADGAALSGDCGEAGAADAACASRSASAAAARATPVRKCAYRDATLESADAHIPRTNCAPVRCEPAPSPSAFHQVQSRVAPAEQYTSHAKSAPVASRCQAPRADYTPSCAAPCVTMAAKGLNQYQQYALETQTGPYEVKPIPGAGVPRASIGTGHPRGPIAQVVPKPVVRGAEADLSPLLPCTYPANQYVVNPPDGDHYHRTSVYAASGLPIDMPAYTGPRTWTERMQHARP
eukprot:GEMP01026575.1.p1 GENE.GEMP01026575.1~~GEMP01026575.1.p1  ORF type:complete len:315 (+),score=53.87 GEMP01026575.1:75-1019(+)